MEQGYDRLSRVEQLAEDNNRMLHAMRRAAFLGGVFKMVMYVIFFIALPYWAFQTYLSPMLTNIQSTLNQVQGAGQQIQQPISNLQGFNVSEVMKAVQEKLQAMKDAAASTNSSAPATSTTTTH